MFQKKTKKNNLLNSLTGKTWKKKKTGTPQETFRPGKMDLSISLHFLVLTYLLTFQAILKQDFCTQSICSSSAIEYV